MNSTTHTIDKRIHELAKVQTLLQLVFGIVPMVAGADKFTNLLTIWGKYLDSSIAGALPLSTVAFMLIVGVIEILAGILVFLRPKAGGYVVCTWLVLISINLFVGGTYFDVAVRDLVMAVGAFSMAKIAGITHTNIFKLI
jgi:hypothetical protein